MNKVKQKLFSWFMHLITLNSNIRSAEAKGTCKVMCFSPKSNLTIPIMSVEEIRQVINTWVVELQELGKKFK